MIQPDICPECIWGFLSLVLFASRIASLMFKLLWLFLTSGSWCRLGPVPKLKVIRNREFYIMPLLFYTCQRSSFICLALVCSPVPSNSCFFKIFCLAFIVLIFAVLRIIPPLSDPASILNYKTNKIVYYTISSLNKYHRVPYVCLTSVGNANIKDIDPSSQGPHLFIEETNINKCDEYRF